MGENPSSYVRHYVCILWLIRLSLREIESSASKPFCLRYDRIKLQKDIFSPHKVGPASYLVPGCLLQDFVLEHILRALCTTSSIFAESSSFFLLVTHCGQRTIRLWIKILPSFFLFPPSSVPSFIVHLDTLNLLNST